MMPQKQNLYRRMKRFVLYDLSYCINDAARRAKEFLADMPHMMSEIRNFYSKCPKCRKKLDFIHYNGNTKYWEEVGCGDCKFYRIGRFSYYKRFSVLDNKQIEDYNGKMIAKARNIKEAVEMIEKLSLL